MTSPDVDTAFAAFRRDGSAAALANVFDATASELLRVADHLLGDVAAAEDAVQETFLAAIEARATAPATNVRAWLLAVLHNRVRRIRRERARNPDTRRLQLVDAPPADGTATANELDAAVGDAIQALPETYRSVLRLHLKNDLSPADIALALDRAPATVRTQLSRGLALLRGRLPRSLAHGLIAATARTGAAGRGLVAVREVVLHHAAATVGVATATATALGGLLVLKKALLLTSVAAIALFAVLTLPDWFATSPTPTPTTATTAAAAADLDQPPRSTSPVVALAASDRTRLTEGTASSASPGRAFGSVVVHVTWSDTHEPAPQVPVQTFAWSQANPFLHRRQGVTDGMGQVLLDRVPAGRVKVMTEVDEREVDLAAGAELAVELGARRFAWARGTVVAADGTPVAGATVIESGYFNHSSAYPVATTDAAGRFECPIGQTVYLGARCAGHAPSCYFLQSANAGDTVDIVLRLRGQGGTVRGTVRDARGRPIAGALVALGQRSGIVVEQPDGSSANTAPGPVVATDADGRFEATGLALGENPVVARALDHGMWRGAAEVRADAPAELAIELADAATIHGHVVDERGQVVAGAQVHSGEYGDLDSNYVTTATDGQFALDSVPPGVISLRAAHEGSGSDSMSFSLAPGERVEWTATLHAGPTIQGVVVDDRGQPLAGVTVHADAEKSYDGRFAQSKSDRDGRFRLTDLDQALTYTLTTHPDEWFTFPSTATNGVAVGDAAVTLVVRAVDRPTARLKGRVVDGDGRPCAGTEVTVYRDNLGMHPGFTIDATTGEFAMGPFPPGRYRVAIAAAHLPEIILGPLELEANTTRDLGAVRLLPAGTLTVDFAAFDPERTGVSVVTRSGDFVANVKADSHPELAPGEYLLQWRPGGWGTPGTQLDPFVVRSGETTSVRLVERPIRRRELAIRRAAGKPGDHLPLTVEVRDRSGVLIDQTEVGEAMQDGGFRVQIATPTDGGAVRVRIAAHYSMTEQVLADVELSANEEWSVAID